MAFYICQESRTYFSHYGKLKQKDKFYHLNKEEAQKKHWVHLLSYYNHDPEEDQHDKFIIHPKYKT